MLLIFGREEDKEVGAELVDYEDDQVKKADAQLDIGFMTKVLLAKLTDKGHDPHAIKKFYDGVRSFYEKACSYARNALPLGDPQIPKFCSERIS